jgi:hypothetical protein
MRAGIRASSGYCWGLGRQVGRQVLFFGIGLGGLVFGGGGRREPGKETQRNDRSEH